MPATMDLPTPGAGMPGLKMMVLETTKINVEDDLLHLEDTPARDTKIETVTITDHPVMIVEVEAIVRDEIDHPIMAGRQVEK